MLTCVALCGSLWLSVALCGSLWSSLLFHSYSRSLCQSPSRQSLPLSARQVLHWPNTLFVPICVGACSTTFLVTEAVHTIPRLVLPKWPSGVMIIIFQVLEFFMEIAIIKIVQLGCTGFVKVSTQATIRTETKYCCECI